MIYKEPYYKGKNFAISFLKSDPSNSDIANFLIGLSLNEEDLDFALRIVKKYCYSQDHELQGIAILCLSHLAKIHKNIPINAIVSIFDDVIKSEASREEVIKFRIADALNDFYTFCNPVFQKVKEKHKQYLIDIDIGIDI